ncbi:MAG: hypothetical protein ACKVOY_11420 [Burkholderiaceae bacterium]
MTYRELLVRLKAMDVLDGDLCCEGRDDLVNRKNKLLNDIRKLTLLNKLKESSVAPNLKDE